MRIFVLIAVLSYAGKLSRVVPPQWSSVQLRVDRYRSCWSETYLSNGTVKCCVIVMHWLVISLVSWVELLVVS